MQKKRSPRSIAVFRALQLGDLLCTVPAFRALREAYPGAQITLIGLPWASSFAGRFSHYLDDFISFPGWPGLPEQKAEIEQIPAFLSQVQERKFDLVIQMQGSGYLTNPLISLFGAKQTAGFYLPGQFKPDEETFFPYPKGQHEIRAFLSLVSQLGIRAEDEELEFPVTEAERAACQNLCQEYELVPHGYVCLHPGARAAERRWPIEKFAAVGDELSRLGYQVVLTGIQAEKPLTQSIARQMALPALDLAGKTDLGTLAVLMANAELLVCNDTGVSHMASALQVPSVILFHTTQPERWGPLDGQLHRPITHASLASPQDVLAEANQLLNKVRSYAR